jgi:arginine exporter protein ArgO
MTAALVAGLIAGYGIAVPVGAVAALLVTLTARTSLRVGMSAALGVATADGLYALTAVLGGSALTPLIEPLARALRLLAALILLALAAHLAAHAVRSYRTGSVTTRASLSNPTPRRAYLALLGVTMLNPSTAIYFAALSIGARAGSQASLSEQLVFVLGAVIASASWQVLLAAGGALLGGALTSRRGRLVTALVATAVITVSAARIGFTH